MSKIKKECPGECCEFSLWEHTHFDFPCDHKALSEECAACEVMDMIELEFIGMKGQTVVEGFIYCRDHFGKGRKFSAMQGLIVRNLHQNK